MGQQRAIQQLAGLLALLGAILVVLGAGLSAPNRVLIGTVITMSGATVYWTTDAHWERYEQFREPDIDYGTRNTLYRSLFKTGSTVVQFGLLVLVGDLLGITIAVQALTSPPSLAAVTIAVVLGLALAGSMLAVAASLETDGASDRSPLAAALFAQSPPLLLAVGLVVAPVAAIYFAGSWVVGRLGGLPIAYYRSQW